MVRYPGKAFGAVYLPSSVLLWTVSLFSIIVATGYNYNAALDGRFGMLDIYAENRVEAVSSPRFEPEPELVGWRNNTVARVSADDFVVLLPQLTKEEFAVAAAESILTALHKPILAEGQEIYLDASIGISYYPNDGLDADALIGAANSAMTMAKESGAGSFHIFTQSLNARISKRMSLESRLRKAVEARSFAVYYQPRVELPSRRVVGMEALVRWVDGDTVLPPGDFIPLAEENGLIVPIGEWVLKTALSKLGVGFSLDDFGTDYSSLYYLKRLPLDWLKIDQSFVRDIRPPSEGQSNAIVSTIIEMARSLGLGTIAEGCETEEQLRFLVERGCHYVQGYYFSRPVPAAEFERFIGAKLA